MYSSAVDGRFSSLKCHILMQLATDNKPICDISRLFFPQLLTFFSCTFLELSLRCSHGTRPRDHLSVKPETWRHYFLRKKLSVCSGEQIEKLSCTQYRSDHSGVNTTGNGGKPSIHLFIWRYDLRSKLWHEHVAPLAGVIISLYSQTKQFFRYLPHKLKVS